MFQSRPQTPLGHQVLQVVLVPTRPPTKPGRSAPPSRHGLGQTTVLEAPRLPTHRHGPGQTTGPAHSAAPARRQDPNRPQTPGTASRSRGDRTHTHAHTRPTACGCTAQQPRLLPGVPSRSSRETWSRTDHRPPPALSVPGRVTHSPPPGSRCSPAHLSGRPLPPCRALPVRTPHTKQTRAPTAAPVTSASGPRLPTLVPRTCVSPLLLPPPRPLSVSCYRCDGRPSLASSIGLNRGVKFPLRSLVRAARVSPYVWLIWADHPPVASHPAKPAKRSTHTRARKREKKKRKTNNNR